jgi:hypothetical protein
MPKKPDLSQSGQWQNEANESIHSSLKIRRPWHRPDFLTLEVSATEQQGNGNNGHCWNRWKCS